MAAASARAGRDDAAEAVARLALRLVDDPVGLAQPDTDPGTTPANAPSTPEIP
jgi:hypothetical protein